MPCVPVPLPLRAARGAQVCSGRRLQARGIRFCAAAFAAPRRLAPSSSRSRRFAPLGSARSLCGAASSAVNSSGCLGWPPWARAPRCEARNLRLLRGGRRGAALPRAIELPIAAYCAARQRAQPMQSSQLCGYQQRLPWLAAMGSRAPLPGPKRPWHAVTASAAVESCGRTAPFAARSPWLQPASAGISSWPPAGWPGRTCRVARGRGRSPRAIRPFAPLASSATARRRPNA